MRNPFKNDRKRSGKNLLIAVCLTCLLVCLSIFAGTCQKEHQVDAKQDQSTRVEGTSNSEKSETKKKKEVKKKKIFGGRTISIDSDTDNVRIETSCYQDPYVFMIGYSTDSKYTAQFDTSLELSDTKQNTMKVFFAKECKECAKDQAVIQALKEMIAPLQSQITKDNCIKKVCTILKCRPIGDKLEDALAESYESDEFWVVSALATALDEKTSNEYTEKAYQAGSDEYFSVFGYNLSKEKKKEYAEEAYQEGRIDFFSMLMNDLSASELKEYRNRAKQDGRDDFYSMLK